MPSSRRLIASNTLGSSAASVTFSSIPGTYTDLILRAAVRTDNGFARNMLQLEINGITTNSYSQTNIKGEGSTASSSNQGNVPQIEEFPAVGGAATSNTFSSMEIYIPSYTVSQNKPLSIFAVQENNSSTANDITGMAGLWRNTGAITTLLIRTNSSNNFVSGSSFFLYGLSNT